MITFKFKIPESSTISNKDKSAKQRFWTYTEKYGKPIKYTNSKPLKERGEVILSSRFSKNLKAEFLNKYRTRINFVLGSKPTEEDLFLDKKKMALAASLEINVKKIDYGSLELLFDIGPISNLVAFFDSNIELFEMFLYSYVPLSFHRSLELRDEIPFEYDVHFDSRTLNAFNQGSRLGIQHVSDNPAVSNQNRRNRLLWYISNFSLLIPLGVSIYLFMWYANKLDKIQDFSFEATEEINDQRQEVLDEYRELVNEKDSLYHRLLNNEKELDRLQKSPN